MLGKIENECSPRQQFGLPMETGSEPPLWRPIHYLGSKLRLVEPILELVDDLDPAGGAVCDLFAGSGTVSMALARTRDVVAVDIQEYSRVLCTALLRPVCLGQTAMDALSQAVKRQQHALGKCLEPILAFEQHAMAIASIDPTPLCDLAERGSLLAAPNRSDALATALRDTNAQIGKRASSLMVTRYYGGIYFSYQQTLCMDSILAGIDEMPSEARTTCLAALLGTASHIVNSVGKQFAQPMRPRHNDGTIKKHLIGQMCRDRRQDAGSVFAVWLSKYCVLSQEGAHRVIRGDYRSVLSGLDGVSAIYADPPYTRDHYSRFYHVLETLCLRDSPDVSTTLLTGDGAASRGVYRTDRHQSPFCIKTQAPKAFAELFAGARKLGIPLLVSYSPFVKDGHPRLMTVAAVAKLAAEYYREVEVKTAGQISHSKLNKTALHLDVSTQAEIFIICRP